MNEYLIEVQNVRKIFRSGFLSRKEVVALDNVSFFLMDDKPYTMTIAGESGSGKTTLALMVLGFLFPTSGKVLYRGVDVRDMKGSGFADYRREVQAIFQDPYSAFNPFYKIDHIFDTPIRKFNLASNKSEVKKLTTRALEVVQLNPDEILGRYPHELSGGQLQRIMIARAFLLKPRLIVADEPVSMIDVSLRAIILDIMINLKNEFGISQIYITHDLSTALQISDELFITYKGTIVEKGDAESVIQYPQHPYTQLLIKAIPLPDPNKKWADSLEAVSEEGDQVITHLGCKFVDLCPFKEKKCSEVMPPFYSVEENHFVRCYLYE